MRIVLVDGWGWILILYAPSNRFWVWSQEVFAICWGASCKSREPKHASMHACVRNHEHSASTLENTCVLHAYVWHTCRTTWRQLQYTALFASQTMNRRSAVHDAICISRTRESMKRRQHWFWHICYPEVMNRFLYNCIATIMCIYIYILYER